MKKGEGFALLFAIVLMLMVHVSEGFAGSTMVDKNLFAPDRKPPSPEVETTPQRNRPGVSIKAIQLDGIMIEGKSRKALIRYKGRIPGSNANKQESPYSTVQEGEVVGDYKVVKIDAKSITLEKDGKQEEVNLFAEGKVVPPVPHLPEPPAPNDQQESPTPQQAPSPQAKGNMIRGGQPPPATGGNNPAIRLPQQDNPNAGIPQPGGQSLGENPQGTEGEMPADEPNNEGVAGPDGDGQ